MKPLLIVEGYRLSRVRRDEARGVQAASAVYAEAIRAHFPELRTCVLYAAEPGQSLPQGTSLADYAGLVIGGSSLHAYDSDFAVTNQVELLRAYGETGGPIRIYHNPRCSKSRAALTLLQNAGLEPEVIEYLKNPPTREALATLVAQIGIKPADLLRRGETIFREHYAGQDLDDDDALNAMVAHPILIERPIVVMGERAVVGRPPERVHELQRQAVDE